jgi:hypothetical protein
MTKRSMWRCRCKFIFRWMSVVGLILLFSGCQATKDWLEKSDYEFAGKVYDLPNSEICIMSKYQRHGPETTKAINTVIRARRLDCNEDANSTRTTESPAQREQRINEAIQLLNNAAQMGTPTMNQPMINGLGQSCTLSSQSRSGLYMNCSYKCGAGTVYRTFSGTSICPLSVSQ